MTHEPLANSMLVIMVRGLFSKMQFPYAQFPCSKLRGFELFDVFWEAVERLERCGFNVLACTCDGLSVNRRFFQVAWFREYPQGCEPIFNRQATTLLHF